MTVNILWKLCIAEPNSKLGKSSLHLLEPSEFSHQVGYAAHGRNFAKAVLRFGRERGHLNVIDNQWGADLLDDVALIRQVPLISGVWGYRHMQSICCPRL